MNDMAEGLTDADLQKFADTIAKLPPPQPGRRQRTPPRMARAPATGRRSTAAPSATTLSPGTESVPRIAAQREDYLLKTLREYKAGKRAEYQPVMAEVMPPLKDEDIVDLAHFLRPLQPAPWTSVRACGSVIAPAGLAGSRRASTLLSCARLAAERTQPTPTVSEDQAMTWTTPTLVEICIGLEINGYLPAEF